MSQLKPRQLSILAILDESIYSLKSKEIHDKMHEDVKLSLQTIYDDLSYLEAIELIERGQSEIDDKTKKTALTYVITKKGRDEYALATETQEPEPELEPELFSEPVNDAFNALVNAITSSLPVRTIDFLDIKLDTLEQLKHLMSDEIGFILSQIIDDLKK